MGNKQLEIKKKTISDFLSSGSAKKQLQMALPNVGITPDRMIRLMFSSFAQIPKLIECDVKSVFNAMIMCASLGLEPNTPLGHAYLIPYKNNKKETMDCQFQIGYKGILSLARRSGEISSWISSAVHQNDFFKFEMGTEEFIKHIPCTDENPGGMTYTYSVVKLKDGGVSFEVMSSAQVNSIRARSKTSKNGPWVTDYEAMARKTVMKRHSNYLPLTIELAKAVVIDGKNEVGDTNFAGILDIEPETLPASLSASEPASEKSGLESMAKQAKKKQVTEWQAKLFESPEEFIIKAMEELKIKKKIDELNDDECKQVWDTAIAMG